MESLPRSRTWSGAPWRRRRAIVVAAVLVVALTGTGAVAPPAGAQTAPSKLTSKPLTPTDRVQGARSKSGRAAKTDKALLTLPSAKPVPVMVKLDYDSLAAYSGNLAGMPATSPAVTGKALNSRSAAATKYQAHVAGIESRFLDALHQGVPSAEAGAPTRVVYGGIPVELPGNQVSKLLKMPGVAAVQSNAPEQMLTDSSPEFIGANPVYQRLGGVGSSGTGIIVGVLDSGAWPEHPSYVDPGNLPAPAPTNDGAPRECNFGDNPQTPAVDVFVCNDKLIGGRNFMATYNALVGGDVFPNTARDSNGHGTHTSTTAAGGQVAHANPLGIDRGAIHGIAPAAEVSVYKVCGLQGCFPSDSAAAVGRAILDGVDVINFSISGGTDPFSDPVELAFLDAYAAGVFVSTSAGNEGPGPATVNHVSPWVTSVAASTQARAFTSTVTLSGGGATLDLTGSTITSGITTPTPVVLASAPPYSDNLCSTPAPAGTFTGKIVVCQRDPAPTVTGRIEKGRNVFVGGAAGMLLYNPTISDTETDNHFLPTVHLEAPQGAQLVDFVNAHPGTTATFPAGVKSVGQGDVVTGFSSRGPGGDWLKPDIAAPGTQILAGNTPIPDDVAGGAPGNLFQAIAGTSMASPHIAGAGALVRAVHPDWTPGQIRSALISTATTAMTNPDGSAAGPFDRGGGRVQVDKAADAGLTFDETAANFAAAGSSPLTRIDLNIATINAPVMPGSITTTRVARNVTGSTLEFDASATSSGGTIKVSPSHFTIRPGRTVTLTVTINGEALATGQYFGQVDLDNVGGDRDQHLPVAFNRQQGAVSLSQACSPSTIPLQSDRSTCTVNVQNNTLASGPFSFESTTDDGLSVVSATGATRKGQHRVTASADLAGFDPGTPTVAPGASPGGFIPLALFGVTPIPVGDEQALNFTVPSFLYGGVRHNRIGVTSNGYIVVDGTNGSQDIDFLPQVFPNPARPNNVLAPFWTDLDGTGAPGISATELTDGVNTWIVVEWSLNVFGTNSNRHFQVWLGEGAAQDISYTYDPAALPADPNGQPFNVGAENVVGNHGSNIAGLPVQDLVVTSTNPVPGQSFSYSFQVKGTATGLRNVTSSVDSPVLRGTTQEVDQVRVT